MVVIVRNKIAKADNTIIVNDNTDYIVHFDLDEEWNAYDTKTMRVSFNDGTYVDRVFQGTDCEMPKVENQNGVFIGVYAGDLRTTTPAFFDTHKSILGDAGQHVEPSEDVYDQITDLLNRIVAENSGIESIDFKEVDAQGNRIYTITLENDSTYDFLVPKGDKGDKGDAGEIGFYVVSELPEDGEEGYIYLVPKEEEETENVYDEYIWINGEWEKVGSTTVEVDLTDYVKFTDYATTNKGGVFKTNSSYGTSVENEYLKGIVKTFQQYNSGAGNMFISKTTLENVLTGKNINDVTEEEWTFTLADDTTVTKKVKVGS